MITTSNGDWDARLRRSAHHGMDVPAHARHVSPEVIAEGYRRARIQLPPYRRAGRDRPGAARQATGHREPPPRARDSLPGVAARPISALTLPLEPHMGAQQLAKLCGGPRHYRRPASNHAGLARSRDRYPSRRDERASRGSLSARNVVVGAACSDCAERTCRRLRHSEEAQDRTVLLPMFASLTAGEQDRVVAALSDVVPASCPHGRLPTSARPTKPWI